MLNNNFSENNIIKTLNDFKYVNCSIKDYEYSPDNLLINRDNNDYRLLLDDILYSYEKNCRIEDMNSLDIYIDTNIPNKLIAAPYTLMSIAQINDYSLKPLHKYLGLNHSFNKYNNICKSYPNTIENYTYDLRSSIDYSDFYFYTDIDDELLLSIFYNYIDYEANQNDLFINFTSDDFEKLLSRYSNKLNRNNILSIENLLSKSNFAFYPINLDKYCINYVSCHVYEGDSVSPGQSIMGGIFNYSHDSYKFIDKQCGTIYCTDYNLVKNQPPILSLSGFIPNTNIALYSIWRQYNSTTNIYNNDNNIITDKLIIIQNQKNISENGTLEVNLNTQLLPQFNLMKQCVEDEFIAPTDEYSSQSGIKLIKLYCLYKI